MSNCSFRRLASATLIWACLGPQAQAQTQQTLVNRLHGNAVASFQQARFPEAYGRFSALADAGHAPSAEMALFMFEHGTAIFGRDWDVSPEQLTAWAALASRPPLVMKALVYPRSLMQAKHASR